MRGSLKVNSLCYTVFFKEKTGRSSDKHMLCMKNINHYQDIVAVITPYIFLLPGYFSGKDKFARRNTGYVPYLLLCFRPNFISKAMLTNPSLAFTRQ
jgi:hypothetical protein